MAKPRLTGLALFASTVIAVLGVLSAPRESSERFPDGWSLFSLLDTDADMILISDTFLNNLWSK
jgi:hypothetical protein